MWDGEVKQLEKKVEKEVNSVLTALSVSEKYYFRSHFKPNAAFQSTML